MYYKTIMVKKHVFNFSFNEFSDITELTENEQILIEHAKKAARNAYAPYSNFYVGSAVLLSNGQIITGNNQGKCSLSCWIVCRTGSFVLC